MQTLTCLATFKIKKKFLTDPKQHKTGLANYYILEATKSPIK